MKNLYYEKNQPKKIRFVLEWVRTELPEEKQKAGFAIYFYKYHLNLLWTWSLLKSQHARVLDIGSGIGILVLSLHHLGYSTYIVDIDDTLKPWLIRHGLCNTPSDLLTEPLPFPDASFDLVSMLDVIKHFHGSPRHAINEICRVLKSGVHLILETPNIANLRKRLNLLFGRNHMSLSEFYNSYFPYTSYVHEYMMAEIKQLLQWNHFYIVRSEYHNFNHRCHQITVGYAPGDLSAT